MSKTCIVADFGNSQCKLARFDNEALSLTVHFPYHLSQWDVEKQAKIKGDVNDIFTGHSTLHSISVLNQRARHTAFNQLKDFLNRPLTHVEINIDHITTILNINNYPTDELGMDRAINVIASQHQCPDSPFIVIDVGTATTLDAYCPTTGYLGGLIIPGFKPYWETLHRTTAQLPIPPVQAITPSFGTNTYTSIQRGVGFSYIGMLHALITDLQHQFPDKNKIPKVLWTGGGSDTVLTLATELDTKLPCDSHDPYLTLRGIYYARQ